MKTGANKLNYESSKMLVLKPVWFLPLGAYRVLEMVFDGHICVSGHI